MEHHLGPHSTCAERSAGYCHLQESQNCILLEDYADFKTSPAILLGWHACDGIAWRLEEKHRTPSPPDMASRLDFGGSCTAGFEYRGRAGHAIGNLICELSVLGSNIGPGRVAPRFDLQRPAVLLPKTPVYSGRCDIASQNRKFVIADRLHGTDLEAPRGNMGARRRAIWVGHRKPLPLRLLRGRTVTVVAPTVGARHVQWRRSSIFKHVSAIGFHLNLGTVPKLRWYGSPTRRRPCSRASSAARGSDGASRARPRHRW